MACRKPPQLFDTDDSGLTGALASVARHSSKRSSASVLNTFRVFRIILTNAVKYVTNVESYDRRIQSAINIQGKKMQRRAEFLLMFILRSDAQARYQVASMPDKHEQAALTILKTTEEARRRLNEFSARVLRTRGGRIGSGMGAVIEALWGFFVNQILLEDAKCRVELAWMYGHEYNDFACIGRGAVWHPETREGELLRVEVKSMVASADESKAHFDRLRHELHETDLLAVFLWDWLPVAATGAPPPGGGYVSPQVKDYFVGRACDIAALRDALHRERGGTFVESGTCPDKCAVGVCTHIGEPLNARGSRERISGPNTTRTKTVSYQANFGGLVRMLGCRTPQARTLVRKLSMENTTVKTYLDFAARNFLRVAKVLRE